MTAPPPDILRPANPHPDSGAARPTPRQGTVSDLLDVLAEWALYVSAALVMAGLLLPSIHKPGLIRGDEINAVGLVGELWSAGEQILAAIIVVFAFAFPLLKTLAAAWVFRFGNRASPGLASLMSLLGKWSMLDVFLAALLIAFSKAASLFSLEPRLGLYLFAAGVLLNNLATTRLSVRRSG